MRFSRLVWTSIESRLKVFDYLRCFIVFWTRARSATFEDYVDIWEGLIKDEEHDTYLIFMYFVPIQL